MCVCLSVLLLIMYALPTALSESSSNTSAIEVPITEEPLPKQVSRGGFEREIVLETTAYNWTGYRCANMQWPVDGVTVAMNGVPFGTHVYIPGIGERIVQDRPDDKTQLDIYMGNRKKDAIQFGRQKLKVTVRF